MLEGAARVDEDKSEEESVTLDSVSAVRSVNDEAAVREMADGMLCKLSRVVVMAAGGA